MYGLSDRFLAIKNNGFLYLGIEGDSNVIIDCYNKKKSNLPSSIILLMKNTQRLSQNLRPRLVRENFQLYPKFRI